MKELKWREEGDAAHLCSFCGRDVDETDFILGSVSASICCLCVSVAAGRMAELQSGREAMDRAALKRQGV